MFHSNIPSIYKFEMYSILAVTAGRGLEPVDDGDLRSAGRRQQATVQQFAAVRRFSGSQRYSRGHFRVVRFTRLAIQYLVTLAPAIRAHTAGIAPPHHPRRLSMRVSAVNTEDYKNYSHSPQQGDMAPNQSFFILQSTIDKAIKDQFARDDTVKHRPGVQRIHQRIEAIYIPQGSAIYGLYTRGGMDTAPLSPATSEPQILPFEMSPHHKLLNWSNINSKYEDIAVVTNEVRPPTSPHDAGGPTSSEPPSIVIIKLVDSLAQFFDLVAHKQAQHRSQRSGELCENQLLPWSDFKSLVKLLKITGSMHDEEFPEMDGFEARKTSPPIGTKKLNQALSGTPAIVKEPDSNSYTAEQNGNPDISDRDFRSLMKATKPRWDKWSPTLQHRACKRDNRCMDIIVSVLELLTMPRAKAGAEDLEKAELRKIFGEELDRQTSAHTPGERSKQSLYYTLQVDRLRTRRNSVARAIC
ncbi:hypothetical protein BDZ91DRAFT_762510 [Kalaharituber pfeilii]|nr:hypothetical protein BDZ91DRAFT_762510 [Kalaharituber pfeilii]